MKRTRSDDGFGYYGGMMDGIGWVWMALFLAVLIILVAWGTRAALWSRGVAGEPTPLEVLRGRYRCGRDFRDRV